MRLEAAFYTREEAEALAESACELTPDEAKMALETPLTERACSVHQVAGEELLWANADVEEYATLPRTRCQVVEKVKALEEELWNLEVQSHTTEKELAQAEERRAQQAKRFAGPKKVARQLKEATDSANGWAENIEAVGKAYFAHAAAAEVIRKSARSSISGLRSPKSSSVSLDSWRWGKLGSSLCLGVPLVPTFEKPPASQVSVHKSAIVRV